MNAKQVCVFLCLALLGGLISPLAATQPFWSMEPSTREIERADSLTGFNISKYVVNLQINDQTRYIQGSVTAFVDALQNLDGIDYELEGDSLHVASPQLSPTKMASSTSRSRCRREHSPPRSTTPGSPTAAPRPTT
jgi:hypothetical protein